MEKEFQNSVYVRMMADSLRKKENILQFLYDKTKEQESMLREKELDFDQFQLTLDEKGERIEQLDELDQGFDTLFRMVEKEIQEHRQNYRDEIVGMQERIRRISDLGVQIQALEHQNSERLKGVLAQKRNQIREFRVNEKTSSTYYKNMGNAHRSDQSYFFNEIK